MPRFSEARGVMLLTVDECAEVTKRALKSIRRALAKPGVYVERHPVARPGRTGGVLKTFIDPATLGFEVRPFGHKADVHSSNPRVDINPRVDKSKKGRQRRRKSPIQAAWSVSQVDISRVDIRPA